ncbi:ribonuclease H-like protein [Trichoderma evansii]
MASSAIDYGGLYDSEYDEGFERIFDPQFSPAHRRIPADQLIVYNSAKRVQQLREMNPRTNKMSIDRHTVVVSIDGACRGNGTSLARAAWGVYFGPQSAHNSSGILDPALPQTSTRAEIEALSQALDIICSDVSKDFSLQRYCIITDSSYLVQTFSKWIQNWIANGGKTSAGKKVAHFETLKKIHERLDDMTYGDNGGMDFKFWQVPREKNQEADLLANEALDKESGVKLPRVLSISLNHRSFFDAMYDSLLTKIRASSVFQRVEDGKSAIRMLQKDPQPYAVLITDEALTFRENAPVWDAVLKYIRQGGTAVIMGHFPCFVKPLSIKPFFAKAGLEWEQGSYQRTTLVLNPQAVGVDLASKLLPEYSQKAVFLNNVKSLDALYVTNEDSVLESLVFQADNAHVPGESPVLLACVGKGKLGYIGDVNGEDGSEAAVIALCGL